MPQSDFPASVYAKSNPFTSLLNPLLDNIGIDLLDLWLALKQLHHIMQINNLPLAVQPSIHFSHEPQVSQIVNRNPVARFLENLLWNKLNGVQKVGMFLQVYPRVFSLVRLRGYLIQFLPGFQSLYPYPLVYTFVLAQVNSGSLFSRFHQFFNEPFDKRGMN